ncbi:hypothetical protein [Micromonospora arida]
MVVLRGGVNLKEWAAATGVSYATAVRVRDVACSRVPARRAAEVVIEDPT